jgi:hypothetical protein
MIRALGYSHNSFDPTSPGRLCRGRERWIEAFELEEPPEPIHRTVISGAVFTDDSASDARRGLPHAGIDVAQVIGTLFARRKLWAFMEDGHPADIPEDAIGVEMYTGHRAGGRSEELMVRWFKEVSGIREIRSVMGESGDEDRVRGFLLLDQDVELDEEMRDRFFLLVGMSNLDSPPARFQPAALPELLDLAKAILLLHRDKQGPALGIYAAEQVTSDARLEALCEKHGTLIVPFAIPPMLARWDRALAELRTEWLATREDEFPVPPSPEPSTWHPRRRDRRRRRKDLAAEAAAHDERLHAEE